MKTITANIPSRKIGGRTYQAYHKVFNQDAAGRWSFDEDGERVALFEAEVIEVCRRATNWGEIKSANFVMDGFSN